MEVVTNKRYYRSTRIRFRVSSRAVTASLVEFSGIISMPCYPVRGCACAWQAENPGLQKLIFALFGLPFGLFMVMVAGGELFTGNCAVVGAAAIEGKTSFR